MEPFDARADSSTFGPRAIRHSQHMLRILLTCDAVWHNATFSFDVPAGTYLAELPNDASGAMVARGPMSLAEYNEFKLSGFLHEDDVESTPQFRRFSLTHQGRRQVDGEAR